jgi:hypothetical protein
MDNPDANGDQSNKPVALIGTLGWRQFLLAKKEMLDAYDKARMQSKAHEVQTSHGRMAEAQFRTWLESFLPKRYGVCSGYVISQGQIEGCEMPHFDVIIYDQLESPVLWVEADPDRSKLGTVRAIPAEYVRSVIEIKSAFNLVAVRKAREKLNELASLLAGCDRPGERYPKYLMREFFSAMVFFELREADRNCWSALKTFHAWDEFPRGFASVLILRGQGLPEEYSGRICALRSTNNPPP